MSDFKLSNYSLFNYSGVSNVESEMQKEDVVIADLSHSTAMVNDFIFNKQQDRLGLFAFYYSKI